jgi:hypothetical protein
MSRLVLAVLTAVLGSTPAASAALTPRQLLARYQPSLVLARGESFRPSPVEHFLGAADLEARAPDGRWILQGPATVPPSADPPGCTSARGLPCWRLNLRGCAAGEGLASIACYAAAELARDTEGAVYGRVASTKNSIVLQYWYLYAFNFWSARNPPSDFIWRSHEGDWELAAVLLSRKQRPLALALSQHCGGQRRAWANVRKSQRTHPVVYVALGSHANYFAPGQYRHQPRCYPQAANEIFRVNGITPTDYVGGGITLHPAQTALISVSARAPAWMAFPGAWGEPGYFHAPGVETVGFGGGPEGPAFHTTWTDVRGTILRWPSG